jgi:PAS domain S-box-containing protein
MRRAEGKRRNEKIPAATEPARSSLLAQVKDLRARLDEAEQTLAAIRLGDVDALVGYDGEHPQIYTLEGRDFPYRSIVETMASGAVTLSRDHMIMYCNAFFSGMVGIPMERLVGSSFLDLVPAHHRDSFINFIERSRTEKSMQELPFKTPSGKELYVHLAGVCQLHDLSNSCIVVTDISGRKSAEGALKTARDELEHRVEERTRELQKAHDELERRVKERTGELFEMNRALIDEIERRKQLEENLAIKSRTLEEMNTALRVLLKQQDEDKKELEENISLNVKELILPYAEKLKKSRLDAEQISHVTILENNLKEMTSPIIRTLHTFDLTPKEIEVVSYLKGGRTTKQVAELLGVSPRAVEFHRYNIRKKLGLDRKKTNLRSYLLSVV